ncbi:NADH-quinone oxidoreductase subunit NuoH [Rhizomicrobium palustre]|uniref:NADH-quinone oxidoreductase subunit NuoH n=1 Tax=Rhizomicrobium palustre TaxID=189966 RepID=UPI003C7D6177
MPTYFGLGTMPYAAAWTISQTLLIVLYAAIVMVSVAFWILADRKIWAAVQLRRGPNVVGIFGLLQTFADAMKFMFKEPIIPAAANKVIFLAAPIISATLAFAAWAVVPVDDGWVIADINVGVLYLFAISSLGVYGIIMGGWASNSKYGFLSALRSAAQMVSYEVSIGFVIITVLLFAGSLNLTAIVHAQAHGWYAFSILFPMFVVMFISSLAETQRPPFDLLEAESELVAGFMVEYSSTPFLLYFLGEYMNIIMLCALMSIMFLGGWLPPVDIFPLNAVPGVLWLLLKIIFLFFMISMTKAFVPRYRYDQLMRMGWKFLLPISMAWVVIAAGWVVFIRPVLPHLFGG